MEDEDFHKQKTLPDLHAGELKPLPLPKKIGPYKIESLLNKGGMSYLYLAVSETGQPIAIKVLVPKYFKHKEMSERFLKEAHIIGMTNHPNIVKLYGQGQWEKGLYIAMEFVRGVSLRQFIQQKSLSQKRALEIVLQVGYALCHLHAHGVIHRDLKPENILITETGEIKVIDFGIAQLQEEREVAVQTRRLIGTPVYMSPEQKENPEKVTFASDIYSLGVIAYELILGRLSHGSVHLSLLSKPLREILEKALKESPKERYADVVDFITEISQYLKTLREKEGEPSEEVLQMIEQGCSMLLPSKAPHWPHAEIGLALHSEEAALQTLYLDFARLDDHRLAILLVETAPILSLASLRGMFRLASLTLKTPVEILQALNQTLLVDSRQQKFALNFLLLDAEKSQLSFISCGASHLLHIAEGSAQMRTLSIANPPLGSNAPILETTDNWNPGDTLLLHSLDVKLERKIEELLLLSAQHQAEKILASSKESAVGISIRRLF